MVFCSTKKSSKLPSLPTSVGIVPRSELERTSSCTIDDAMSPMVDGSVPLRPRAASTTCVMCAGRVASVQYRPLTVESSAFLASADPHAVKAPTSPSARPSLTWGHTFELNHGTVPGIADAAVATETAETSSAQQSIATAGASGTCSSGWLVTRRGQPGRAQPRNGARAARRPAALKTDKRQAASRTGAETHRAHGQPSRLHCTTGTAAPHGTRGRPTRHSGHTHTGHRPQ
mmetsp:Transcript_47187/g.115629  ORF Transcript_47187/g.115629 Transcript_47187/m.115629 type:complete len:231 (-) Transcript_47187:138-830(-)